MLDEIDAVDWAAVPGPRWYEPDRVASGLRALARAVNRVDAAEAGTRLEGGGIVHGHSATVFPAAVVATPLLVGIARRGHPAARDAALELIADAFSCYPHPGYTRVVDPGGIAVPLCCGIAGHLRACTGFLARQGGTGRWLRAAADAHWRFDVGECVADGGDTAAFGTLSGRLGDGVHAAEMHAADFVTVPVEVTLEYPPAQGCPEACLRVIARQPGELPPVMICGGVSVEIRRGFVSGVESAFRLVVWGAGLGGPLTVGADLLLTLLTNHRVG
ncbi:hypothetical protein OG948_34120 (plasmid) [Embleya sp. NBC_00888]|uniref:hypothetical protein n=1 Tax=Embleya sp. NBC_00888 TaxID=2975960 RepID=UPI00386F8C64|nr:hypothetical protein OG948_34120 [Embleya sp. NBC_00888]